MFAFGRCDGGGLRFRAHYQGTHNWKISIVSNVARLIEGRGVDTLFQTCVPASEHAARYSDNAVKISIANSNWGKCGKRCKSGGEREREGEIRYA